MTCKENMKRRPKCGKKATALVMWAGGAYWPMCSKHRLAREKEGSYWQILHLPGA